MFNLGTYFSIAIIACNLYGLQTKSLDRDLPESVMNTPANQLWIKMLPFFKYVAKEGKCYVRRDLQKIQSAIQNDNQGRLSRIESQQTEIQENLKYLLEILRNNIPENFFAF